MKIPGFQVITGIDELVHTFGNPDRLAAFLTEQQDFARTINERIAVLNELDDFQTQRSRAEAAMAEAKEQGAQVREARRLLQVETETAELGHQAALNDLRAGAAQLDEREAVLVRREADAKSAIAAARDAQARAEQAREEYVTQSREAAGRAEEYRQKLDTARATLARLGG